MEIRPARPEEYKSVGELTIAAYRTLPVDHLWGGYDEEIRSVDLRAKDATILVAVEGGSQHLLGAVTFVDNPGSPWHEWAAPDEVQVRLLAVAPEARGRGVAEALMRDCMGRATAAGMRLVLHTTPHMDAAQRLYTRLGFRRAAERDVHEFEEMPFWAYEWPGSQVSA